MICAGCRSGWAARWGSRAARKNGAGEQGYEPKGELLIRSDRGSRRCVKARPTTLAQSKLRPHRPEGALERPYGPRPEAPEMWRRATRGTAAAIGLETG